MEPKLTTKVAAKILYFISGAIFVAWLIVHGSNVTDIESIKGFMKSACIITLCIAFQLEIASLSKENKDLKAKLENQ